jgi:secreted trypsin-like serine protease
MSAMEMNTMDMGLPPTFDSPLFARAKTNLAASNGERIVGGTVVNPVGKYHFFCAMSIDSQVSCGGSLLSNRWFLSAAHCLDGEPASAFEIICGVHDLQKIKGNKDIVRYKVKNIHVHPGWNKKVMQDDIALFELNTSASEAVHPAYYLDCSNEPYDFDDEETFYKIMGFGQTGYEEDTSTIQMEVGLPIYNKTTCTDNYGKNRVKLWDRQICAGYSAGGKDGCLGDSGGPMVVEDKAKTRSAKAKHKPTTLASTILSTVYKQVGIVSFGIKCAEGKYPGVYTKVNKYIDWIKGITGRDWCSPEY